jgi:dihydrofolate reductase
VISLIVAASENNVIGRGGGLPWHLSADLRRFKALTLGKPIVMGRKTHESIGKPLPGRHNIVMSRDRQYAAPGCDVVYSIREAIDVAGAADEIMVIGGSGIYRQFLPHADRIYLTRVRTEVDGDVSFPEVDATAWCVRSTEIHEASSDNDHAFAFVTLDRR